MNWEKKYRQFQKKWKQGKYKNITRTAGACVTTACVVLLGVYFFQGRASESNIDSLRIEKQAALDKLEAEGPDLAGAEGDEVLVQYEKLHEENPDLVGWLTIDGTSVDYPIMYTPDDPEYYSRRGFDKKKSNNGLLFMDEASNMYDYGGNVIIYGHNMKNGSMFADLMNYKDESYWIEHPAIRMDTLHESRVYEITSVAVSSDMSELPFGFVSLDDEGMEDVLQNMSDNALYDTGVDAEPGDDFLTLATCDYDETDGRLVVMARRIQ